MNVAARGVDKNKQAKIFLLYARRSTGRQREFGSLAVPPFPLPFYEYLLMERT